MLKSRGKNENIVVAEFKKCLWMVVTNQNYIHDDMKSRLNSGNACYSSIHNLYFCALSKSLEMKHTKV
jgi:hypothetical protein